jgi:hypothetical protein
VRLTDDTHQESNSPSEPQSERRYDPGEAHHQPSPVSAQRTVRRSPQGPPRGESLTREDVVEIVEEWMLKTGKALNPEATIYGKEGKPSPPMRIIREASCYLSYFFPFSNSLYFSVMRNTHFIILRVARTLELFFYKNHHYS